MNTPLDFEAWQADTYYAAKLYQRQEREVMKHFMWRTNVIMWACVFGAVLLFLRAVS